MCDPIPTIPPNDGVVRHTDDDPDLTLASPYPPVRLVSTRRYNDGEPVFDAVLIHADGTEKRFETNSLDIMLTGSYLLLQGWSIAPAPGHNEIEAESVVFEAPGYVKTQA